LHSTGAAIVIVVELGVGVVRKVHHYWNPATIAVVRVSNWCETTGNRVQCDLIELISRCGE